MVKPLTYYWLQRERPALDEALLFFIFADNLFDLLLNDETNAMHSREEDALERMNVLPTFPNILLLDQPHLPFAVVRFVQFWQAKRSKSLDILNIVSWVLILDELHLVLGNCRFLLFEENDSGVVEVHLKGSDELGVVLILLASHENYCYDIIVFLDQKVAHVDVFILLKPIFQISFVKLVEHNLATCQ